ncbi:MAG TPA: 50S ribosomal protein L19e [archaeon]|nr:50S ribosomal protein L19e [archaeon]
MGSLQKRLAAKILKAGESRVWLDPKQTKDIEAAITAADVRKMIQKGYVKKLPAIVKMPEEIERRRRYRGSKKGAKHSIVSSKRKWISTVRPLRRMLKELKATQQIDNPTFKHLYRLVKGGTFRSRSHLRIYLEQHGLRKKKE